jgi:hypothetical protein
MFSMPPRTTGKRVLHVQRHHVCARHHERADLPVVQAEHVAHHLVLVRLDHARARALGQHGVDLVLGHGGGVLLHAQQAQQRPRGQRQQLHERLGGHGQPVDRAGHQARQRLGVALAQALGHELAHDDGEVGDEHHHQARGGVARGLGLHAQADEPIAQRLGQRRFAHDAVEHADGGDADLDGGEKARGVLAQLGGGDGAAIALIDQLLQARLTCRNQCQLGHGEQSIEQDEGEQYCYFHKWEARGAPVV